MGVETISEFEKCEFMNMLEFIRRTEIHITISVDKITTMLTGPTLTWENFISHDLSWVAAFQNDLNKLQRHKSGKQRKGAITE